MGTPCTRPSARPNGWKKTDRGRIRLKLLNFYAGDELRLGLRRQEGVLDLTAASCGALTHTDQLLRAGSSLPDALEPFLSEKRPLLFEEELRLAPCVLRPGKIIGVGLNYIRYMEQQALPRPDFPHLFPKFGESVRGSGQAVALPRNSTQVDFEGELAVVMGKAARLVPPETALDYVAGYCCANDVSARDFQNMTSSWLPGKCCDGFTPIGPYLVTRDEVPDPNDLRVQTLVNGEVFQDFCTDDMIQNVAELVSGISRFFTLNPGDILLTGTSVGHIMLQLEPERKWLAPGDVVTVEIDGLGRLTTPFIPEPPSP